LVDGRPVSSAPLCQIIEIPDVELNDKLIPANDNYELTSLSVEAFEAGSILAQRDYAKPSKRNNLGLIAVLCAGAIVMFVLKLANVI
jgi:hypothetical protein